MKTFGRIDAADEAFRQELGQLITAEEGTAVVRQAMADSVWESGWRPNESIQQSGVSSANQWEDSMRAREVASAIRRSLLFNAINHREEAIPSAYETTFEWILTSSVARMCIEGYLLDYWEAWIRKVNFDEIHYQPPHVEETPEAMVQRYYSSPRKLLLLAGWYGNAEIPRRTSKETSLPMSRSKARLGTSSVSEALGVL